MPLTWFRPSAGHRPGTLNLCYNALDRHVIAGHADDVALIEAGRQTSFARLLEQVATVAGGLGAAGLGSGDRVAVRLDGSYDAVLITLAAARVGAVTGDVGDPALLVTDRPLATTAPVRVLRGVEPTDPVTDLTWEVVLGAGRQAPAPCAAVPSDAPAYIVGERTVSVERGADDDSPTGRLLAALCEGRPVEL